MCADSSSEITARPQPSEKEIQFILDAISEYLTVEVRRSDVQSAWSGLRPLAVDPNAKDTASASRDHIVTQDPDGLITVTGAHFELPCQCEHVTMMWVTCVWGRELRTLFLGLWVPLSWRIVVVIPSAVCLMGCSSTLL